MAYSDIVRLELPRYYAEILYAICCHNVTIPAAIGKAGSIKGHPIRETLDMLAAHLRNAQVSDHIWTGRLRAEAPSPVPVVHGGRWIEPEEEDTP